MNKRARIAFVTALAAVGGTPSLAVGAAVVAAASATAGRAAATSATAVAAAVARAAATHLLFVVCTGTCHRR